jgi:hypothetical protein
MMPCRFADRCARTADGAQPTADGGQPTADCRPPTADRRQPTADWLPFHLLLHMREQLEDDAVGPAEADLVRRVAELDAGLDI